MNIFGFISCLLFASTVSAIGLLPSLNGNYWYAGQTVQIQAVQTSSNDGSYYNAYLKSGSLIEQVLVEANYQQYVSFVVPNSFDAIGKATLYVVAQGNTGKDTLNVYIYNYYYYNQLHNFNTDGDSTLIVTPCNGGCFF